MDRTQARTTSGSPLSVSRGVASYGGRVSSPWSLRVMAPEDTGWLVSLKQAALHPDLERLGTWDPERS